MRKSVRACCRINEELHQALLNIAQESEMTIGVAMRRMLMLGVDTYKEKLGRKKKSDTAKTTLLRAERFSIYANILQLVIASEKLSPEKLEVFKGKAKKLLADRWEYGDDPVDALFVKPSGEDEP